MTAGASDPAALVALVERVLALFQTSWIWTETAPPVLAALGPGLSADRAVLLTVAEAGEGGYAETCAGEWRADPAAPAWCSAAPPRITAGGPPAAVVSTVLTAASDARLAADFRGLGIATALAAPIFVSGRPWGTVLVAAAGERAWSESEAAVLRTAARLFGDAIEMAASAMAASETVRRAIMDAAADAVLVLDETGAIADVNAAAARLLRADRAALTARDFAALVALPDGGAVLRRGPDGAVRPAIATAEPVEALVPLPDGEPLAVELTLREMRVGDRRVIAANLHDLSGRRAAEAEIARQRERLHAAEKDAALGSLLAGVAHELNNPLAVVVAQTTLLEGKVAGTPFAERVAKIRSAADRCSRIVKGFLAMAKRSTPSRRTVDLDECVRAAVEMTAYGTRAAGIAVEVDLCGDLSDVSADPDQVTQVVANLILNAQHAMATAPDPRRIRVASRRAGTRAEIAVEDNGPGVAATIVEKIFEPYFTTKPVGAGTGIGLSVSRNVALAHGGGLVHEAIAGGGARFVLSLPLPERAATPAPSPAGPVRVLIVDDEADVAGTLAEILEIFGATTTVATSVTDGLALARASRFAVVFSDLRMPGGGGIGLFRALLAGGAATGARFVLVTGDTVSAAGEVAAAGLADTVTLVEKPFTLPDLRRLWSELGVGG